MTSMKVVQLGVSPEAFLLSYVPSGTGIV